MKNAFFPHEPSREAHLAIDVAAAVVMKLDSERWFSDYYRYHSERIALDYHWAIQHIEAESRVLEIGGYPFFLTIALRDRGLKIQTVDKLSGSAARLASLIDIDVVACDIEMQPLPFSDNHFDEIFFNEVFEHLRIDPIHSLSEILRVLKPGGRLWLSTPNLRSLRGIVNFVIRGEAWSVVGDGLYAQYKHLRTEGWMGHVREYTSKEVSSFLSNIGFEVVETIYRGHYKNVAGHCATALLPSLKPYFSILACKKV